MIAEVVPPGPLNELVFWTDATAIREGILAVAALVVFLVTAPRGRRWLSWLSISLLALSVIPLIAIIVFPFPATVGAEGGAAHGLGHAHHVQRFLLVASFLQSCLLLVVVCGWERLARPMPKIFIDILRCLMLAMALLIVLWDAGINAGELITGSALVTAVLGFALKDTLGNVFAGLAIHAEHPFEVGDWIQYDANQAHIGRVVEVNWRATKVITLDEAYVIVPNGQLAQASIRNFTKPDAWSRRSIYVITSYDVSPQRVQRIILEAIRGSFGVLEHPAPSVVTSNFTDRGVEHWVRLFTKDFDKRDRVDGMARDRIWFALARNGIEIPTATQSIRLTQLPAPPLPEPAEARLARRVESLKRVGIFAGLSPGQLERLGMEGREWRFAGGEPVIRQGEPGESLFVVLEGGVEVSAREGDGVPVVITTLGPGGFFGEMSLMTGAARSATITSKVESCLLEIDKATMRHVLEEQPGLVETLGAALTARAGERSTALARDGRREDPPQPDLFQRIRDYFAM
jgi:small-conductance mechanosensitive channel/CRP-like cAMP-binding protein